MNVSVLGGVLVSGILIGGLYALAALGLSLIMGVMRVVNVAHGAFYMLGAFFIYAVTLRRGMSLPLALIVTIIVVFAIAIIVERVIVRPVRDRELDVVVVTFAAALIFQELARLIWGDRRQTNPAFMDASLGASTPFPQPFREFAVAILLMALLFMVLRYTRIGKAIRMVAQDDEAALMFGINVERVYVLTFGLGCALAAAAAGLLAPLSGAIYPAMGWDPLLRSFVIVIIGGIGSFGGTIVAGIVVGVLEVMAGFYISGRVAVAATLTLLILFILVRPPDVLNYQAER